MGSVRLALHDRPGHCGAADVHSYRERRLTLSDKQLDRYARHIVLKEVGGAGQRRLLGARVAVVGAGGLGAAALPYLAAAGVGRIRLIDDDTVSLSNLQRQTLYATPDIGALKVERAARALASLNPDVAIEPCAVRLDAENADALLADVDVLADGTDNFATRLLIADTALDSRVPLVSAAVGPFDGQIALFRGWEADKPCYRCLVGSQPAAPDRSCADQGVLGALVGIMGAMQALETVRAIANFGDDQAGRLLLYDALGARVRTVALPKDPACPACGIYSTRSPA